MERNIEVPEEGTILYKICPKCSDRHTLCDDNCAWFKCIMPCDVVYSKKELMVVEKKYFDYWRIKDLAMIGEQYFFTYKEAEDKIARIKAQL